MYSIHFETNQFNTTEIGEHFINDCCFGEDLMQWVKERKDPIGFHVQYDGQEDWGWYIACEFNSRRYTLGFGYIPDDITCYIFVEKHRTLKEKLFGKAKIAENDPLLIAIFEYLKTSPFDNVRLETNP